MQAKLKTGLAQRIPALAKDAFYVSSAIAAAFLFREHFFECFRATGTSMLPTLQPDAVLLVDKISVKIFGLKNDDIVVFRSLHKPNEFNCKRVAKIGGQKIELLSGRNVELDTNQFWAEGDNKNGSFDSRHYGPIAEELLVGIVRAELFPRFAWFSSARKNADVKNANANDKREEAK